jgi:hypothetical protein
MVILVAMVVGLAMIMIRTSWNHCQWLYFDLL